jgi:hypothetical protein
MLITSPQPQRTLMKLYLEAVVPVNSLAVYWQIDWLIWSSHFWESNICSATQDIPFFLWSQNIYYTVHKSPLLVHILVQMNPVHSLKFTLILSSHLHLSSPSDLFLHVFLSKLFIHFSCFPLVLRAPPISYFLFVHHSNIILYVEQLRAACPAHAVFFGFIILVRVRVTLRLTVSQSVCLGDEPLLGLMTRY